jgi:hypothetical protein
MPNLPQATGYSIPKTVLMALEILHRAFVFLRRSLAVERAKIFPIARSRIFLARIQSIFAGFQLPDHWVVIPSLPFGPRHFRAAPFWRMPHSPKIQRRGKLPPAFDMTQFDGRRACSARSILRSIRRWSLEEERKKRCENCQIRREMRWKTPVLADVAETAASDVQSAHLRCSDGKREDCH